eukprot:CAMPEP_0173382226 /NCGR_PEP_ID=MMETSP1356-20130122/4714_1 /TAXON_ID=77927 ORGANISM="Hemiselmis virescens, Strain PCC157" /NCGR_SAMPLE_ID=MMETSP1356 /ASSEMBLY_ACC=CAM_ASM_000847 /LENGTH=135 /DNA_ID=CAMNT_0014336457 /DNA_START=172 /DNA_END=579 /DNA_ORIENTATION=-
MLMGSRSKPWLLNMLPKVGLLAYLMNCSTDTTWLPVFPPSPPIAALHMLFAKLKHLCSPVFFSGISLKRSPLLMLKTTSSGEKFTSGCMGRDKAANSSPSSLTATGLSHMRAAAPARRLASPPPSTPPDLAPGGA